MDNREEIRNFCIIAHIDHGKSTLADRFLDLAGAVKRGKTKEQMLDSMDLERERGITIKAKAVRLNVPFNGRQYTLNLIDTPGHVDFTYEVAKSLKGCEGAIMLVDASQGVEAQTVANFHLALESDLKIIPALNKLDLPSADVKRCLNQLSDIFGFKNEEVVLVSAKEGTGLEELLAKIIQEIPHPSGSLEKPLKALLFDSAYDPYKGVILFLRIFDGKIKRGDSIILMHQNRNYKVEEVGVFLPEAEKRESLSCGEVGYICCNIRNPEEIDVGDTVTSTLTPAEKAFPGYKKMPPMVFSGVFPSSPKDYPALRQAMEKLKLSDPSVTYEPDNLGTLGHGFRCGFLGLLHMEIVQERLEREYNLDLILTSPNVRYRVRLRGKPDFQDVDIPHQFPDPGVIEEVQEPFVRATIISLPENMDALCELAKSRRGVFIKMDYLGNDRISLIFDLPLGEIVVDFYDNIKSLSKGYASLDYEFTGYRKTEIVKLDVLFNLKKAEAFSILVHKEKAEGKARTVADRLGELIPRQMYEVKVQVATGSRIIASSRISALKKNVTAKCYGGDITRKRKLWEKQKKGKKKMKQLGNVTFPPDAFLEVLKM
ncbi:MAG: translation elongation factor 4 [Candidatus Omnitrophica bacterium]|nr:translation elongation factor 4 [Candidatus Omnitrophota bacterium]MBU2266045.1 translation elongation factor 4 [Candidatus Omnitrophota bacterium]MBU2473500.1 translation elongation factor 4 [Candidatus Omnitrophota bacterium]